MVTISTAPISPARRRRARAAEARVEAAVEADHRACAGSPQPPPGIGESAPRRGRPASRRTPPCRPARPLDQPGMEVGRGADHDGVDVAVLEDRVDVAHMRAGRRGERLGRRRHGVGDGREPRPRMGGDVGAVDAPDPPGAEKPDPQHFPAPPSAPPAIPVPADCCADRRPEPGPFRAAPGRRRPERTFDPG